MGLSRTKPVYSLSLSNLPQGFIESPNRAILPASLYRVQLAERLGAEALKTLEP